MRRWTLTLFLLGAAAAAAVVAPRLVGPPAPRVEAQQSIPEVTAPPMIVQPAPALIPELSAPPPPAPEPSFWDNCPTCGMG